MRIRLDDGWVLPEQRVVVRNGGDETALTGKESSVLRYLAATAPRAVPVPELLAEVWDLDPELATHTVQSAIYTLRQKIERDPSQPRVVQTVRGAGYRYVAPTEPISDPHEALLERMLYRDPHATATALAPILGETAEPKVSTYWWMQLGNAYQRGGELSATERWVAMAQSSLVRIRDPAVRTELTGRIANVEGMLAYRRGQSARARAHFRRAVRCQPDPSVGNLVARFNSTLVSPDPRREAVMAQCADEGEAMGRPREVSLIAHLLGQLAAHRGDVDAARAWARRAARNGEGHLHEWSLALLLEGALSDDPDATRRALADYWARCKTDPRHTEPFGQTAIVWAFERMGDRDRAAASRQALRERLRTQPSPITLELTS